MDLGGVLVDALRAAVSLETAVYALAAIGLNVHFGYTGLLNFGQVGFMLVGAYGVTATVATYSGPLWLGVVVGIALAVVLALWLGVPTLRLRADYLAITTIAASEILRLLFRSEVLRPVTNGVFGLQRFADSFYALNPIPEGRYGLGRLTFGHDRLWAVVVGWALVVASVLVVARLASSPWGRVLRSIRDDEDAARALGKDVFALKLQSLAVGGVVGALAGMLLAIGQQAASPDTYVPAVTFFAYTLLILGGPARPWGPVLGAVLFWFVVAGVDTLLREAIAAGVVPAGVLASDQVGAVRFALVGLGLMLLVVFRPEGILGDRRETTLDAP